MTLARPLATHHSSWSMVLRLSSRPTLIIERQGSGAYDEKGAEASLKDAMDQLDEVCDVALLCSAKYLQALH